MGDQHPILLLCPLLVSHCTTIRPETKCSFWGVSALTYVTDHWLYFCQCNLDMKPIKTSWFHIAPTCKFTTVVGRSAVKAQETPSFVNRKATTHISKKRKMNALKGTFKVVCRQKDVCIISVTCACMHCCCTVCSLLLQDIHKKCKQ